jgi:hypothetical protein
MFAPIKEVGMAKSTAIDLGAVWLTDGLLAASDDNLNRLALDRVRRDIENGTTGLDGAMSTLSGGRRPRPGEFGLELVTPAVLAALLLVAQRFLERYMQKLVEGAADRAATLTLDRLKELFRREAREDPDRIVQEFEAALVEHGQSAGIDPQSAHRFLALIRDRDKLAAVTSG